MCHALYSRIQINAKNDLSHAARALLPAVEQSHKGCHMPGTSAGVFRSPFPPPLPFPVVRGRFSGRCSSRTRSAVTGFRGRRGAGAQQCLQGAAARRSRCGCFPPAATVVPAGSGARGAGRWERGEGSGTVGAGRWERGERRGAVGAGRGHHGSAVGPGPAHIPASRQPRSRSTAGATGSAPLPQPRRGCSGRAAPGPLQPLCPAGPAHPAAPTPHRRGAAPRTSAPPSLLPPSSGPSPRTAPHRPRPGPAGRTHLDAQRILPSRASCRASPVGAAAEPGPGGGAGGAGRAGRSGPGADRGRRRCGGGGTRAVPAAPGPARLEPRDDKGPEQGMFP